MIMFPADLSEDVLPPPACLHALSRIMAARVETGDPPPGAEQYQVDTQHPSHSCITEG